MRFKFNNTYDTGIGYTYQKDIKLSICPSTCSSKWTVDEETHEVIV